MAAEAKSASLMDASAALVDMNDPVGLACLATETGSVPLSTRLLLKLIKAGNDLVRRTDGTINRRLADLMEFKVPASEVPDRRGISSKDAIIDAQTGLWVRVFLPQTGETTGAVRAADGSLKSEDGEGKKRRVIFYFHGGGFAVLSADLFPYDVFCRRLCRRSEAVVISVNYRRAPEHRYPVAYDDCYAALEWLEGLNGDLFKPHELDLSQCVLMGDSAGANIVHHVSCRWAARNEKHEMPPASTSNSSILTSLPSHQVKIVAHVLLFPYFGGEERTPSELRLSTRKDLLISVENMDWHWRAYLPPNSNRDHPASNVLGPNAPDLSSLQLPPSLIVIAEYDMLKDWQLRYAQGLARASKPVRLLYYVGGVHSFHVVSNSKLTSHMLSDIMSFINDGLDKQNSSAGCK